jgi:hypothetical protein
MAKSNYHSKNWGGKREGSGKPLQSETPTQAISLTLPAHLVEALDKATAKQTGTYSRSALVPVLPLRGPPGNAVVHADVIDYH